MRMILNGGDVLGGRLITKTRRHQGQLLSRRNSAVSLFEFYFEKWRQPSCVLKRARLGVFGPLWLTRISLWPRPVEMFMQKLECAFAVDGMGPDEPFDLAHVFQAQLRLIQKPHFCELVADFFIRGDAVEVPPLHHERPRG